MSTFAFWYVAISPIIGLWAIRALAVTKLQRRVPTVIEILRNTLPNDGAEQEKRWLRIAERMFLFWVIAFVLIWLGGGRLTEGPAQALRGIVGLTMFYVAYVSQLGRSMIFHLYVRPDGLTTKDENKLLRQTARLFPRGDDVVSRFVRITNVAFVVLFVVFLFLTF